MEKRTNYSILKELRVHERLSCVCYHLVRAQDGNLETIGVQLKVDTKSLRKDAHCDG